MKGENKMFDFGYIYSHVMGIVVGLIVMYLIEKRK